MAEYINRDEAIARFGEESWAAAVLESIPAADVVEQKWIPFEIVDLSEEEKEEHPEWMYLVLNCPEDGQEILVSNSTWVWLDVFHNDDGIYLDSDSEIEGLAWMPLPKPYKMEEQT